MSTVIAERDDLAVAAPAKESKLTRERVRSAWLFLAPMLIVLALVAGWPLARTIWFGFTDANLSDLEAAEFIGFANYNYLLTDPEWWNAVWNTFVFASISVTLETIFGLAIALALDAHFRGRGLLRAAVLIPWAIPTVVSAQMWGWMFHDVFGVINHMLMALGIVSEPIAWTASPDTALAAVIMVDV
jgi:trehalose/maltose transport system permease protein